MPARLAVLTACFGLWFVSAIAQAASPSDVVEAIYAREQAEMTKERPETVFSSPALRAKFFSKAFDRLVTAAEAKAARDQDVGPIDFDPIISGQDGEIKKLKVTIEKTESGRAVVAARFVSFGQPTLVTYVLVEENGAWKVDDIRGTVDRKPWAVRAIFAAAGLR